MFIFLAHYLRVSNSYTREINILASGSGIWVHLLLNKFFFSLGSAHLCCVKNAQNVGNEENCISHLEREIGICTYFTG